MIYERNNEEKHHQYKIRGIRTYASETTLEYIKQTSKIFKEYDTLEELLIDNVTDFL